MATTHNDSSSERAPFGANPRGLGGITLDGEVIAIKFLDVEGRHNDVDGTPYEDDFSVVA